jgi:hypothetical protein
MKAPEAAAVPSSGGRHVDLKASGLTVEHSARGAAEALAMGLVHQVVTHGELDAAVERCVAELLQCGPEAQRATKELFAQLPAGQKNCCDAAAHGGDDRPGTRQPGSSRRIRGLPGQTGAPLGAAELGSAVSKLKPTIERQLPGATGLTPPGLPKYKVKMPIDRRFSALGD